MAHQPTGNDETLSEVNVIPLADLSLVLLIILMVISPLIQQAIIQVTNGSAAAAQSQQELDPNPETPLVVSYEPGAIKVNGEVTGANIDLAFVSKLETSLMNRRDKSVNLTASPLLMHGQVVQLMDVIRRHGAQSLVMLKWAPQDPSVPTTASIPQKQGAHS